VRWVGFAVIAYAVFAAAFSAVVNPKQDNLFHSLGVHRNATGTVAALAILVCVLAPLAEELLFRGFMFAALIRWGGPWAASVVVACCSAPCTPSARRRSCCCSSRCSGSCLPRAVERPGRSCDDRPARGEQLARVREPRGLVVAGRPLLVGAANRGACGRDAVRPRSQWRGRRSLA